YDQPALPDGVSDDIMRGAYRLIPQDPACNAPRVTLMGSGAILTEVLAAARQLAAQGIASEVISITSWSELARDGQRSLDAQDEAAGIDASGHMPHIVRVLESSGSTGPITAASDYVRPGPEPIRASL